MAVYAFSAFVGYLVLFTIGQNIIGRIRHARNIRPREAPGKAILHGLSVAFLCLVVATMEEQVPVPAMMFAGSLVAILGFTLSMWAQWELGRFWVGGIGLHKGHQLITSGPYRYVRHPLYAGMLLSAVGLGIFGQNVWFALVMLMFFGAFSVRILGEEQLLKQKFKKQYPAYQESTGMLFPKVRRRG